MNSRRILGAVAFIASVILFISCNNRIDLFNLSDEIEMNQALVVPIAGSYATVSDLLKRIPNNNYLVKDSDTNEIYFEKYDTLSYLYRDVNFVNQIAPISENFQFNTSFVPLVVPVNGSGSLSINSQISTGLNSDVDKSRFDSVYLNSVTLACRISPQNFPITATNVKIKITFPASNLLIPNSTDNSVTFSPVSYNQDVNVVLNDVKMYFPNSTNTIPAKIDFIYTNGSSAPVVLLQNTTCNVTVTVKDVQYKIAYGFFNPAAYTNTSQVNKIDYFSYLPAGYFKFANPQLFMKSSSNVGTHLMFNFDYVRAYLSTDPGFAPIYALFDGSQSFSQSLNKPAKPGDFVATTFRTFDRDFGQTNTLFDSVKRPDIFEYKFTSLLDSNLVKKDTKPDFVVPNSKIDLYLHSRITLYFDEGSYFETSDTAVVNNQIDATLDGGLKIDSCFIVLRVKNAFPCQVEANLRFLDAVDNPILKDVAKNYILNSGTVDADGVVTAGNESNQIIKILIKQSDLEELKKLKYLITTIRVTGDGGVEGKKKIHFTQNNFVDAKIGLYVKFNSSVKFNK